ncbi:MAG: glutathione S-transferase family protein [Proteobacteria bacterium]|nr:glutathione S-transferase family protein [Pseudomonadota bacterium]
MSVKIHAFPASPRSFKVLLVANHLGGDYELCFCDLSKGAQKSDLYTAVNPNQKAPAVEDGDFRLWESNAIIQYLAATMPEAGLLPADEKGRADVARWMFWESTSWDPAIATIVFERVVKGLFGGGGPDAAEVEKALQKFNRVAGILNQHLKGRDYLCGDSLSLADFAVAADLSMAEAASLPLEPYPEIRRWSAQLAELPAWKATRAMQQTPAAAA